MTMTTREVMPMYSVKEAAGKPGVSERRVRVSLSENRIEGKKVGRDWAVLSLDYKRKRRPKTKRSQAELGKKEEANAKLRC